MLKADTPGARAGRSDVPGGSIFNFSFGRKKICLLEDNDSFQFWLVLEKAENRW